MFNAIAPSPITAGHIFSARPACGIIFRTPRHNITVKSSASLNNNNNNKKNAKNDDDVDVQVLKSTLTADNQYDLDHLAKQRRNNLYERFKDDAILKARDDLVYEIDWLINLYNPTSINGRISIRNNAIRIIEEDARLINVVRAILIDRGIIS